VNLKGTPLHVVGVAPVEMTIDFLKNKKVIVNLYVLKDNAFDSDLILGREFIRQQGLTLCCPDHNEASIGPKASGTLMGELPLCVEEEASESLEDILNKQVIDFGDGNKKRLIEIILKIENKEFTSVDDGYAVQVRIKDDSVFAFAPRRFAYVERLQLRAITDDLMDRGVIKPSTSPYCSRIVPVRRKNREIRMCVDLRPLNSRIVKQKYPFPNIEDCISRLYNKAVFTLFDLKDSFHQIRVHSDSTKYFSFATAEGQFEYNYLPFGYSEDPAEFQKRILQILNTLIRQEKIIVYMDDILIPTETVEENLSLIEEVLTTLKKYRFEVNYAKCRFLKSEIEFLGYIISRNNITLSAKHTEAIDNFSVSPSNVHDVQRFLGLASYFRKFIRNFELKAKPLQEFLK